jgi:nitronate monooxygenase
MVRDRQVREHLRRAHFIARVKDSVDMTRARFPVLRHPIVAAPLAGGASTQALTAAVSRAGGLGFLAAGYKGADRVGQEIADIRRALSGGEPFGVNVFAPPGRGSEEAQVRAYATSLRTDAERLGVELGEPRWDDDSYAEKLDLLHELHVPVVSFTFGCPSAGDVARLQDSGSSVWVTVTTVAEARVAAEAGVDALVVQGVEAGGHRGGFDDAAPGDIGLLALLQLVDAELAGAMPLVATGGIATGGAIAAVLAAGASAAQLGTAFLRCPEAGTSAVHVESLARDVPTGLTRAFTGRMARGIVNRFLVEHTDGAPSAYPEVHHLTAPLRSAARERGDIDILHLWAGQTYSLGRALPAADVVAALAAEARTALEQASRRLFPQA